MASIRQHGLRAVRAGYVPAFGAATGIAPAPLGARTVLPAFSARSFSSRPVARPSSSVPLGSSHRPRLALPPSSFAAQRAPSRSITVDAAGEAVSEAAAHAFPPVQFIADLLLNTPTPSYGLSIIVLTLALRFGITVPLAMWQRKRMRRERELVVPEMKKINDRLAVELVRDARREGLTYEDYRKKLKAEMAKAQSALHKQHSTHPLITLITPLAVHIPILIITSMAIRHAIAVPDSALAADSFLWIPKLGDVDPEHYLPIIGAMCAFGNAEASSRKRKDDEASLEAAAKPKEPSEEEVRAAVATASASPKVKADASLSARLSAKGRNFSTSAVRGAAPPRRRPRALRTAAAEPGPPGQAASPAASESSKAPPKLEEMESLETQAVQRTFIGRFMNGLSFVMRGFAVLFLPIGAVMPSGVVLYWVTSIAFSLAQTLYLGRLNRRERAARAAASASMRLANGPRVKS